MSHLRRRMYHVKQLRRRSGNSTYCQLPAVGRAQADRRQGLDRDRVGKRAGNLMTPVGLGIQVGGPGGRRMVTAGTALRALVHDGVGDPRRTRVKTMMMSYQVRLIDAPEAQSTGTLRDSVVATRARSGLGLVDQQWPRSRPPMTAVPNHALRTVIATRDRFSHDVVRSHRRRDNDPTYGGIQQMTSLLRGPLGGAVLGIFPMTAEPDRLHVVGRDVLLLRHRAHFTHAVRVLLAAAELVNDIAVPQQDGFAVVARFVTDAAADAAVVIATLGVHDRMTTSVDREREILMEGERILLLVS